MHVLQRKTFLANGNIALGKEAACSDAQRAQKLASIAGRDKGERALLGASP